MQKMKERNPKAYGHININDKSLYTPGDCDDNSDDECSQSQSHANSRRDYVEDFMLEKMCIYLAKMAMHDEEIS